MTFDGTLNATPQVSPLDAGLTNAGSDGSGSGSVNNFSSITSTAGGSAQYVADLVFTPLSVLPYVNSSGKGLVIGVPAATPTANAMITAVSATLPTVTVTHADTTQDTPNLYGPVWADHNFDLPFVMYQLLKASDGTQYTVLPTDVVTATIPFATVTVGGLGPNGPITNQTIDNYVGRYEPGLNGCPDLTPRPILRPGWCTVGGFFNDAPIHPGRNGRLRFPQLSNATYDYATNTIEYLTPNTNALGIIWSLGNSNQIDSTQIPVPEGVYSFVFQDQHALDPTNYLKVWIVAPTTTCAGADTSAGPGTGTGSTYVRSVAADGVTVTISYWLRYASDPNVTHGYNLDLFVYLKSQSGFFDRAGSGGAAGSGPISNFWCFSPATRRRRSTIRAAAAVGTSPSLPAFGGTSSPNTTGYPTSGSSFTTVRYSGPFPEASGNDTSDPLAMSTYLKLCLTAANGNGPSSLRSIYSAFESWVDPADLPTAALWSYANDIVSPSKQVTVTSIRAYNTNPSSGTYAWSSTRIYHPLLGFDGFDNTMRTGPNGVSIPMGAYIDLTAHAGGTSDNGASLNGVYMEAVCSAPHPFRGADILNFVFISTQANYLATTGGANTTLPGTVTATAANTTITFTGSVTIANGTTLALDSSGLAYHIGTGGTNTVFTIDPPYQGSNASGLTATLTAALKIAPNQGVCYPTSETTFVFTNANYLNYVSGVKGLAATSTITVSLTGIKPLTEGGIGSPEFWTKAAVEVGAKPWFFTTIGMSDACLQQLAINMAPYCPPGTIVQFELGDEHWNGGPGQYTNGQCITYGSLLKYVTPGTVVNDFYTVPASNPTLNYDEAYVVIHAHQHAVLQAQFDALGSGILVEGVYGSWYTDGTNVTTSNMIAAATGTLANGSKLTQKVPIGSIAIAPYQETPTTNTTYNAAISTTGTNPGSWPTAADQRLSETLFQVLLEPVGQVCSSHVGYRGLRRERRSGGDRPDQRTAEPDRLRVGRRRIDARPGCPRGDRPVLRSPGPYSPDFTGFASVITSYLQGLQDGDPRVPNSGLTASNYQNLTQVNSGWVINPVQYWELVLFQNQPPGDGYGNLYSTFPEPGTLELPASGYTLPSPNQFASAQGGAPGLHGYNVAYDRTNQSIALMAILNWIEAAGIQPPTPPSPSFTVRPARILPNNTTAVTLVFSGVGTSWTSGSTISIQNSVTGSTNVTAGTWTAISTDVATLTVTTPTGSGSPAAVAGTRTYTITIDAVVSPALSVAPRRNRWFRGLNRLMRAG